MCYNVRENLDFPDSDAKTLWRNIMKFKERYLAGEIPFEEIDRYIEEWGNSDETCTLREYLGLNAEEEDVWISDSDEALQELLDSQKKAR